jgi:alpha-1,6-mannosyltransferase
VPNTQRSQKLGIFLFVFAGVIFRSEIAVLLLSQLLFLLIQSRISLQTMVPAGISSALVALAISIPIDSYFWQTPIWPELAGFYYNAIQGKSADWGTSPLTYYFSSLLPKLLLNPLILILLIPLSFLLPSTKYQCKDLVIPSILFVAIYSLQPHKEARFIIYVIPPMTAAASLSASYIWNRRSKSFLYKLGSLVLLASVLGSFVASLTMLLISSLNYPGGDALSQLHNTIKKTQWLEPGSQYQNISIHMDVLSCMTGVTRFQEMPWRGLEPTKIPIINGQSIQFLYDKTEDEETLLLASFWEQFDYALMEEPERAIGNWEIVSTVFAYSGIEFLRPKDGSSFSEHLERVYAANNLTAASHGEEAAPGRDASIASETDAAVAKAENEAMERRRNDKKAKLLFEEMGKFGTWNLIRDGIRDTTGGWWIGPRMSPKIRILRRVKNDSTN